MTILVVDDEPDSLELIDKIVKHDGYETVLANSGFKALEIIGSTKPELVILDVIMPEMNGLDVIRQIRMNKKTRRTKVIMLSALGSGIQLMLEKKNQADYYMSKPFSAKELSRVVDSLLRYEKDEVCWVNYNEIRKMARVHKETCIHCSPNSNNGNGVEWKRYTSIEVAEADCRKQYPDYAWSPCKICLNGDNSS